MPLHEVDIHPAYVGMGSAYAPANVPEGKAQYIRGFTGARRGRMRLAPVPKRLQQSLGIGDIHATAVWLSASGAYDRLLLFNTGTVYSTPLYNTWKYDERVDGQHSFYQLGSIGTVDTTGSDASQDFACVQFHDELIFSMSGMLYRYYIASDGLGSELLYLLGVTPPGVPTVSKTTGGSLTATETYAYELTYVDERGRESSPSPVAEVALTGGGGPYTAVDVTQNTGPYAAGGGETTWRIYRRNPSSSIFQFVVELPLATLTYKDTNADDVIALNEPAPTAGENDPPTIVSGISPQTGFGPCNVMTVWKDRLVLANTDNFTVAVSNASSPTQFSSLPLPGNSSDGVRLNVGGKGQNDITGLESLGSLLAIFGRNATALMYGEGVDTFTVRETLQRGCQNSRSVQRCENVILFLSDDGVYSIGYEDGYTAQKVSADVDDYFKGWTGTGREAEPTLTGRKASVQVSNALFRNVTSWYSENRYFLSFGDKTLVYDLQTGGWTDAGYGFVKTATRYLSQMTSLSGSPPETVFLTLGAQV